MQWCPPCMRLLPEYRKAARSFEDNEVGFGTVDCTIHSNLCHMVSAEMTGQLGLSVRHLSECLAGCLVNPSIQFKILGC